MTVKPIMKPSEIDPDGVSSIILYPAERVREIFSRMKAARGTGREAAVGEAAEDAEFTASITGGHETV
jgi:hypothetical protein